MEEAGLEQEKRENGGGRAYKKNWSQVRTDLHGHRGNPGGSSTRPHTPQSSCILRKPIPQEREPVNRFVGGETDLVSVWGLLFAMVGPSAGPMDSRENSAESRAGERKVGSCVPIKSQLLRPGSLSLAWCLS